MTQSLKAKQFSSVLWFKIVAWRELARTGHLIAMLRASRRMEAQTGSNSQIYSFATNHFFLCSIYAHSTLVLRSCLPNLMNLRTSTSFSDVLCDIATSFLSWSSVIIWALEPNSVHFLTSSLSSFWPWYSYDRTLPTMRNSDLD